MTTTDTHLSNKQIGFIGGGNMASAIIRGVLATGIAAENLSIGEPDASRRSTLAQLSPALTFKQSNDAVCESADIVLLAVKPQLLPEVLSALSNAAQQHPSLFISIAAGVSMARLAHYLPTAKAIVRAMPNLGAAVGRSMTGMAANAHCGDYERADASAIMSAIGEVMWLHTDRDIDAITAIAGSGPAYLFLLLEQLQAAAQTLEFDRQAARQLALTTAAGAVELLQNDDGEFSSWRERVTSPGGTTAAALDHLLTNGFNTHIQEAVFAAFERAQQLAESADKES
ncbi:MAG: pyrroline-5-carboxylate reductase [Pseudomonadota bacterium]